MVELNLCYTTDPGLLPLKKLDAYNMYMYNKLSEIAFLFAEIKSDTYKLRLHIYRW